jgi:hypothetical protein
MLLMRTLVDLLLRKCNVGHCTACIQASEWLWMDDGWALSGRSIQKSLIFLIQNYIFCTTSMEDNTSCMFGYKSYKNIMYLFIHTNHICIQSPAL